jgi:hypothetical protein
MGHTKKKKKKIYKTCIRKEGATVAAPPLPFPQYSWPTVGPFKAVNRDIQTIGKDSLNTSNVPNSIFSHIKFDKCSFLQTNFIKTDETINETKMQMNLRKQIKYKSNK